ncbi:hypothetical protein CJ030_MR2G005723 [Morella rubra]|uniref:CCHC-type domain-containing protein n=1 Tax=Morella rubra TaxID=262757 RepID=A0A6A1WGA5_9ROSI|nr:hypothetical protein CJ030_MR2G005723 [Morella rubra]
MTEAISVHGMILLQNVYNVFNWKLQVRQTHGLPVGQTTRNKAGWAASKVGKVLVVDFGSQRAVWVTPFVWVKVLIDISKSLCPGFFLPRVDRAPAWVQFKFERIFGFCFNCGRIGHMTSTCCAPSSMRVDPDYFSSRMFAMVRDYRRFLGTSLSGNRSEGVASTTLGVSLIQPNLPLQVFRSNHHLHNQVHNQSRENIPVAPELKVVAVKIVRWSRLAIMVLRRPASSHADCPCRSLIFEISDICDAQKAGPTGEISTEEVGGTVSPAMLVYTGESTNCFYPTIASLIERHGRRLWRLSLIMPD